MYFIKSIRKMNEIYYYPKPSTYFLWILPLHLNTQETDYPSPLHHQMTNDISFSKNYLAHTNITTKFTPNIISPSCSFVSCGVSLVINRTSFLSRLKISFEQPNKQTKKEKDEKKQ